MTPLLQPDLEQAQRFLSLLDPDAECGFTYQVFDDSPSKRGHLAKVCHGLLEDEARRLTTWSAAGSGVFVTNNKTSGLGRKTEDVTAVRAVFVDLDGAPLQPVLACRLEPHIIVETSTNRFHAYWLVDGLRLEHFHVR